MTYVNANVYTTDPTAWAHDDCLPDDQFDTVMLPDFGTGHTDTVTGYWTWDRTPHRQQKDPWHWWPVYGAPKPCAYCGRPVR